MRLPRPQALALALLALALPPVAADADTITAERPFALITERGDATSWRLQPDAAGVITAEASWRGADRLALILNGPGQTGYFAREDGPSPLVLRFRLTPDLLRRQGEWRLSLVNFSGQRARGDVRITWPGAEAAGGGGAAGTTGVVVPQRIEGRATVSGHLEERVASGRAIGPDSAALPTPPVLGLEPPPASSGDVRRTVLPDGRVRFDHPDGSAVIYGPGSTFTLVAPDGTETTSSLPTVRSHVQEATLPPPPGDPAFQGFLGIHEELLLRQIRFLVDREEQAVANYLAHEATETATVVERIDMRRHYVDVLLGLGP